MTNGRQVVLLDPMTRQLSPTFTVEELLRARVTREGLGSLHSLQLHHLLLFLLQQY